MSLLVDSNLLTRAALSAPMKIQEIRTLSQVILAVSILSIFGAGWIVLSFCFFKEVRTFRHQLILGLAISDFWMAVNFLSSCAVNLSGHNIGASQQKKFCGFNGFMTQFWVVQTDYWVLVIAVCTYLILANHKHAASWVQDHRVVLWCLPWGFSVLWAALGLGLDGYSSIGAWCWFGSDKVRLLVNFIPRWLIILVIMGLYAHLYRIIYTAHNRFMSFQDENSTRHLEPHSVEPETVSVSSTRRIGRPTRSIGLSSKDMDAYHVDIEGADTGTNGRTHTRQPSRMLKRLARQMMYYPIVYMLIWTIPTTIRIYQSTTGQPAPFAIATVDKACIVIQGFADAIIYGVNESSLGVWRSRFGSRKHMASSPAQKMQVNIEHEIRVERAGTTGSREPL